MAKQRIIDSIVGGSQESNIAKVCKAVSVNLYPESQDGGQASSTNILRSIQGTSIMLKMPEKHCRGLYRASRGRKGSPVLYGVFGMHLYLIADNYGTMQYYQIGNVSNGLKEPVYMCETGGYGDAHPHLIVADGAQLYAVDTTLTPAQQMLDYKAIALPEKSGSTTELIKPSHVYYLYGYLAVLDQGSDAFYLSCQYPFEEDIYGDDIFMLYDHTYEETYTDQNNQEQTREVTRKGNIKGFAIYSEWSTDTTRALIGAGSFLYTFGDRSFQVFSYHDDVNYPFQSPDTAAGAIGILAPRSVVVLGQNVFWLGSSDVGQNGVWMMQGANPTRISTNDIEREIDAMPNPEDAIGQVWQEAKHVFYAITFRAGNRTFVYDATEGKWSQRASFDSNMPNNEGKWRPQYAVLAYNKLVFGTIEDEYLIYLDDNKWTEYDGLQIVRRRVSGAIIDGWSPFYCDSIKLMTNNGQVPAYGFNPKVSLRYSWNGMDWLDQEIGTVGQLGYYDWVTQWWKIGMGSILMLEFSSSDPWDFSIIGAKIQGEPCCIF